MRHAHSTLRDSTASELPLTGSMPNDLLHAVWPDSAGSILHVVPDDAKASRAKHTRSVLSEPNHCSCWSS